MTCTRDVNNHCLNPSDWLPYHVDGPDLASTSPYGVFRYASLHLQGTQAAFSELVELPCCTAYKMGIKKQHGPLCEMRRLGPSREGSNVEASFIRMALELRWHVAWCFIFPQPHSFGLRFLHWCANSSCDCHSFRCLAVLSLV
jgi:hypothetical protein